MSSEVEIMRTEYDFSKARKNPYIETMKSHNGQLLTVYVSPDTAKEAERLGGDYQAIFGKLLDKAVKAYQETL
ncbi:hypothetical protein AALA61_15820 [Oscillospiraceae bacterium 42-9]